MDNIWMWGNLAARLVWDQESRKTVYAGSNPVIQTSQHFNLPLAGVLALRVYPLTLITCRKGSPVTRRFKSYLPHTEKGTR